MCIRDSGEVRVKREDLKNPTASSIPDSAMAALAHPDLLYPIMADDDIMGDIGAADMVEAVDGRSDEGGDGAGMVTNSFCWLFTIKHGV